MQPTKKYAEQPDRQYEILLPTVFDRAFDYRAPEGLKLNNGDIVSVPFGKQELLGVVWGAGKSDIKPEKIKEIIKAHHEFPPLAENFCKFIDWAAWYNCAARGAMLKMVLPIDEIEKKGRVHLDTTIDTSKISLAPLSKIQQQAAKTIEEKLENKFSVTLLDGVTGSGKTEVYFDAIAHLLRKAGEGEFRKLGKEENGNWRNEEIRNFGIEELGNREEREILSSKSPKFLNSQIQSSQFLNFQSSHVQTPQTLILLPEIGLSVQWLARFEKRFGFKPVVWHSGITPAKKRASWQAIARGEARVVVGARSALFLPYKNLSLIVVDEEHDASYKQEDGVCYHARDMAVARGRFEGFPVALVSATPSLESYYNAKQGKYSEISLPLRHAEAVLPDIHLIDMRREKLPANEFISAALREKLANTLADGNQSMLFLNRRGYAPLMLCRACGHRFQCDSCSAWLVTHRSKPRLECHHCGYNIPIPKTCPACGAEDSLHACGPGVERLEDEVKTFLPQARVAVMASDSTSGYSEMEETIKAMGEKRIDILIGTQMIAKGHHFADLAVVGVVDADLGLAGGDLRASERTYQLLHQLSGRAGRENTRGEVFLQSYLPEHPVIKALVSGDREAFLNAELTARENAGMPPFSRLGAIIVDGDDEGEAIKTANHLARVFPSQNHKLHLYGPAPAPLFMLRGKFRYRLLVKAARSVNLPDLMKNWVESITPPRNVRIKIDIDPQSFM